MKTILDDLWVPCSTCPGPASPDAHNLHVCGACNGTGRKYFRPNCTIFLDLDQVFADFDQGVYDRTGKWPWEFETDDAMWRAINALGDLFATLPVIDGSVEFYQWVRPLGPYILTACPNSDYQNVALQKKHWILKNLPERPMVLPIIGGKNKGLFMHSVHDILVDDFDRNCQAWADHGGIAIQHQGTNFADTKKELVLVLRQEYLHKH